MKPPFKGVRKQEVERLANQILFPVTVEGDRQYYLSIHAGRLQEPQVRAGVAHSPGVGWVVCGIVFEAFPGTVEGDRQYYLSIHAGRLLEPQVRVVGGGQSPGFVWGFCVGVWGFAFEALGM
jgi:hypothetical protein